MGRQVFLNIADDDAPDIGAPLLLHVLQLLIEEAEDENSICAAICQLVLQLPFAIKRIGGDDNAAGFENAVISDDELGGVGHIYDSPVVLFEAVGYQARGERVAEVV